MALPPEKNPIVAPQQKPIDDDVMSVMKGDSLAPNKQMDALEIVKGAATAHGHNPEQFMRKLAGLIKQRNGKLFQVGNVAFLLMPEEQGAAEVVVLNPGGARPLMEAIQGMFKVVKGLGLQKVRFYTDNPAHEKMLKSTGLKYTVNQSTKNMGGQMKPMYVFEVNTSV